VSKLFLDEDIKIAGDKPSLDIKKNMSTPVAVKSSKSKDAKKWGKEVALEFIKDVGIDTQNAPYDFDMLLQRRLLLSFTATVGFEKYCLDDSLCGIAQKSFLDTVKKENDEIYRTSQDTGAFSFYYLAFRRGGETDRRVGQTFAMLCSHDGDPVYQELGEALYCWFMSVVKAKAKQLQI
jgi:hypothetical protein